MMITLQPLGQDLGAVSTHIFNFRRSFPLIFHPGFKDFILGISKIVEGSTEKGIVIDHKSFGEFRAFGFVETLLMVFPKFQRQGIGQTVVSLLIKEETPRFFVSATSNLASRAFFNMQSALVHSYSNHRYSVYKTQ
jgi:GNAT superfamily N-acetyltransferase